MVRQGARSGPVGGRGIVSRSGNYIGLGISAPAIDFQGLSLHAPALAGDLAFRRFCVPRFSEYRTPDHTVLVNRARHHLRQAKMSRLSTYAGETVSYELSPDGDAVRGNVLVVHGWTSEASFMMALAEPLRRSGYRVVLVDCPAHGRTREEQTTLIACARAVVEVVDILGPFDAVVAHSMGALAALMAGAGGQPMPHRVVFDKYCLIAAPNRFSEVTGRFARQLGVSRQARRQFERQLERIAHMPIDEFRGDRFLRIINRPALFIHARDDRDVPFRNAEELVEALEKARLLAFEGFGHRRILYAPPVVRAVVSFLRE